MSGTTPSTTTSSATKKSTWFEKAWWVLLLIPAIILSVWVIPWEGWGINNSDNATKVYFKESELGAGEIVSFKLPADLFKYTSQYLIDCTEPILVHQVGKRNGVVDESWTEYPNSTSKKALIQGAKIEFKNTSGKDCRVWIKAW